MTDQALAVLRVALAKHAALSRARLETLALLITGVLGARTVNLAHVASERVAPAKVASTYRRFQRFFQYLGEPPALEGSGEGVDGGAQGLDPDWAARLIVGLVRLRPPWPLSLDRTNWKIGGREVNVLVLAVIGRRHRVPVMWQVLGHAGNSSTAERIALIERYCACFGAKSIKHLTADREFVGTDWFSHLEARGIAFAIRLRASQRVLTKAGDSVRLERLLRTVRGARQIRVGLERTGAEPLWLTIKAKRIKGVELLVVAANRHPHHALTAYRQRWGIECLFAEAKTRGLNFEDTRLGTDGRLALLMAVVALAMAWASRLGSVLMGTRSIPRKAHGYPARSWFRLGLDRLRQLLRTDPTKAVKPWKAIPNVATVV